MRIITGKFKGKRLAAIKGNGVRPTSDRVKESLFSILRNRVIHAAFLDLCAGTGNMGLEALSRGAESATFIDASPRSIRGICLNLEKCGLHRNTPQVRVVRMDAQKALAYLAKRKTQFDLVYFDPPYDSDFREACLKQIGAKALLSKTGIVVVEHRKLQPMPPMIDRLTQTRQQRYGDTVLSFYEWDDVLIHPTQAG